MTRNIQSKVFGVFMIQAVKKGSHSDKMLKDQRSGCADLTKGKQSSAEYLEGALLLTSKLFFKVFSAELATLLESCPETVTQSRADLARHHKTMDPQGSLKASRA